MGKIIDDLKDYWEFCQEMEREKRDIQESLILRSRWFYDSVFERLGWKNLTPPRKKS